MAHDKVPDDVVKLVRDAVLAGMGMIFLHSAHHSKPFRALLGTSCNLTWRESGDSERLWVIEPAHPITRGIDRTFTLEHEETYGEPFVIPTPDKRGMSPSRLSMCPRFRRSSATRCVSLRRPTVSTSPARTFGSSPTLSLMSRADKR